MGEKEYYTYQEVIMGLRSEYLKQMELLRNLKQFCRKDEKKVKDFKFFLDSQQNCPAIGCIYDKRLNCLQRKIEELKLFLNLYIYGDTSTLLQLDNGIIDFYQRNFPVCLPESTAEMKRFYNAVLEILNSPFSQGMHAVNYIYNLDSKSDLDYAYIGASEVQVSILSAGKSLVIPDCLACYNAYKDEIVMVSNHDKVDDKVLECILNIGFPVGGLNEYQKKTILESEDTFKPIKVEPIEPSSRVTLQIKEDNGIILSRKK